MPDRHDPTLPRPRTTRWRPGRAYEERWTNAKAAFIGFMLGRGYSSPAIADTLADGTSGATVRRMVKLWGLTSKLKPKTCAVILVFTHHERALIEARARQEGITMEEYCRQFLISGAEMRSTFALVTGKGR